GELEPAEAGVARAVEADRVRRAAACDQELTVDADLGELTVEPEHERVDAVVVGEQVGAETDDLDRHVLRARPLEQGRELGAARRTGEPARGPARPERREP